MGNQFLIAIVVMSLLGGGLLGSKISSLNPFSSKNKVAVAKSESTKEEYFRDKIKGVEYRAKESYKNKTPVVTKRTLGQILGNFIDKSLRLLIFLSIAGIALFWFTGINIINVFKRLKRTTKALTQVIRGTQEAKKKMNGEQEKLRSALKEELDEDSKKIVKDIKMDNNIK